MPSAKIASTDKTKGLSKYIFAPMELIVDTRIILNGGSTALSARSTSSKYLSQSCTIPFSFGPAA
jgi:hypothetical protein